MEENKSINEINFELATEAGRIGTWKRDLSTNLITQSPITSEILGHGQGETVIPFEMLDSYTYQEDLQKFREPLEPLIESGEPFDLEFRIWHPDGKLRWIAIRGKSIKDELGKPVQVIGVMFDITERKQAAERFRLLTEYSPDGILVELENRFVYANPTARQLLGITEDSQIFDRSFLDFANREFHDLIRSTYLAINEVNPASSLFDLQMTRTDGSCIDVQAVCGHLFWDGQEAMQIMLRDVTELKKSQSQIRHLSERLQMIVEGTGEGIWEWNILDNSFVFSGGFNKIIGHEGKEFSATAADWYGVIHPDDLPRVQMVFQNSLSEKTPVYSCEFRVRSADNNWKWVRARGVIVEKDKNYGEPIVMAGTLSDITFRKESDELAWKHANLDPLTELPNRHLFYECLEMEIQKTRHTGRQIALLFVNLDGFKFVNDFYGHDSGDLLLIGAARRMKECLGNGNTVARIGGDEFIVILSDLHRLGHTEYACSRILASLEQPFDLGKNVSYVSASIGVSLYPLDATEPEELIRKADQAMHVAKQTGKNRFAYFTTELDKRAHERLKIMNELRAALSLNQFEIHYQPIVDLNTKQVAKAEALLRWSHPVLGSVSPSVFIPLAEELGLITPIGNWMFKEAVSFCKQCEACLKSPFKIGINMSPIQFMSDNNDSNWIRYLAETGLSGDRIVIEITEGILLNASDKVFGRFNEFRKAGIQIALDDFGTGYSSMSYLQKFDIDYIKIDKSFIQNITASQGSRTIAETIIVLAHKLGKKVIAEGIETSEQLEFLTQLGCDYGQGYLFSRAVTPDRFIKACSSAVWQEAFHEGMSLAKQ